MFFKKNKKDKVFETKQKIDKLRIEKGWTLYKLAEESEITQSTLSNMFIRKTQPSIATLTNICNGLNISLSEFYIICCNLCFDLL